MRGHTRTAAVMAVVTVLDFAVAGCATSDTPKTDGANPTSSAQPSGSPHAGATNGGGTTAGASPTSAMNASMQAASVAVCQRTARSTLNDIQVLAGRSPDEQVSVLQADAATAETTSEESQAFRDQSLLLDLSGSLDSAVSEIEGGQHLDLSQLQQEINYTLIQC